MARWPNVPAMFGWLRLDRRGKWYLIDRGKPGFDEHHDALGSSITSPSIVDFIERNYQADVQGRWFWQNGPQRVFVDLDLAPLIFRVFENPTAQSMVTHCGDVVSSIQAIANTPSGELWLQTNLGPGVIHDLDLAQLDITDSPSSTDAGNTGEPGGAMQLLFGGTRYSIVSLGTAANLKRWGGFDPKPRQSDLATSSND